MRILVVEPERRLEPREIRGSLEEMQEIVGGLIQSVYPFEDDSVALVCNEGKLLNLPANRGLQGRDGQICDIVFGTFFLCGAPEDGNYFVSLTEDQLRRYMEVSALPEVFLSLGGRTIILPSRKEEGGFNHEGTGIHPQFEG